MNNVSVVSMVGMICTIVISFGLPLALFIIMAKKKAEKKCFAIGAVTFIIFALGLESICHRIVMNIVSEATFTNIAFLAIYGGLAAGIFEETGRLVAMKTVMKKNLTKKNAIMYGVGHGGIEAIIVVGLLSISNLIVSNMINSGTTIAIANGSNEDQLSLLINTAPLDFYMAGVERISAITLHICLSYLVYLAVKNKKYGWYCLAVLVHAIADAMVLAIAKVLPIYVVEVIFILFVFIIAYFTYKAYQKEPETEIQTD